MTKADPAQSEITPPAQVEQQETTQPTTNFAPYISPAEQPSVTPTTPESTAENERLISNLRLSSNETLLAQLNGGSDDARIQAASLSGDRSKDAMEPGKKKEPGGTTDDGKGGDGSHKTRDAQMDFSAAPLEASRITTDRADVTMHPNGKLAAVETTGTSGKTRMEFDENGRPTRTTIESASSKEVSEYHKNGGLSSREFTYGDVTSRDTYDENGKQLTSEVRTPDSRSRTTFDENGKPVKVETADSAGIKVEETKSDGTKITSSQAPDGSTSFRQEDPNGDVHTRSFDVRSQTHHTGHRYNDGSYESLTDSPKERIEHHAAANEDFKTTVIDKAKGTITVSEGGKNRETVVTNMRGA